MKYVMMGDLHGSELRGLETALDYLDPDVLICLGDFDQIKTIHQFRDIEERYENDGKKVIKVAGNHDHAILTGFDIYSGTLRMQDKTSRELHEELKQDPVAIKYIDDLVNTNKTEQVFLDKDKFGEKYRTIIIHGAYDGDLYSYPSCSPEIKHLWMRLRTKYDYAKNFDVMQRKGFNVMIRGHDHEPSYAYEDSNREIFLCAPKMNNSLEESHFEYKLKHNRRYVINPGALFNHHFAMIDTDVPDAEEPILKYFKL